MLLAVLAFDVAAFADAVIPANVAAIVALVVGIVALVLDLHARGTV